LWRHQWLKDGAVDLIFALDLFFTMLTFCPSYHSLNFIYDPQRDLDLYNEEREREEELEMQNISTTGDALRLVG